MCTVVGSGFWVLNPVIKIRYLLFSILSIPLLQHSIIPTGIYGRLYPSEVPTKPGPLATDSFFLVWGHFNDTAISMGR